MDATTLATPAVTEQETVSAQKSDSRSRGAGWEKPFHRGKSSLLGVESIRCLKLLELGRSRDEILFQAYVEFDQALSAATDLREAGEKYGFATGSVFIL